MYIFERGHNINSFIKKPHFLNILNMSKHLTANNINLYVAKYKIAINTVFLISIAYLTIAYRRLDLMRACPDRLKAILQSKIWNFLPDIVVLYEYGV